MDSKKKFTISELKQMRESEDHVEFKKGEGGNVSYNGKGKHCCPEKFYHKVSCSTELASGTLTGSVG